MPFKKILVANRGEIAVRIIRCCQEMGIGAVAVYSDADRQALHVRLAQEAYHIGGSTPKESYLSIDRILDVARQSKAEAVHPGYGFLAENPSFAEACQTYGLAFIGPSAATLRTVGNKTAARRAAQAAGVPIVPGTVASLNSHAEAVAIAAAVGYPVLLKPAAGGGGKGMHITYGEGELRQAIEQAAREAETAFGDPHLYVEKLVQPARHIEVQILADNYGNIISLGERDCSIQRRYQKVVEESPSPGVDAELRGRLTQAAINVAQATGYRNAGTVEFLVNGKDFHFLEVNARLQVEHPVTELVTGIDMVKEQILLAAGEPLHFRQEDIISSGVAIQCRIYAEDPIRNFAPSPGKIRVIRETGGPGVRIDSGVEAGTTIPVDYDGLLAKLVVWGNTRGEAMAKMKRALGEYQILGINTTIPFKKFVIDTELFRSGEFDTNFISNVWEEWTREVETVMAVAAIATAVAGSDRDHPPVWHALSKQDELSLWKLSGRWEALRRW